MKKDYNYADMFITRQQIEKQLKYACPNIEHKSGIYFYIREKLEQGGGFACYIGKSVDVLDRCIAHQVSWEQRIDISLKSRKYYSKNNLNGWRLNVLYFPEELLYKKERYYIELYQRKGYEMLNIESGGLQEKFDIAERKSPKTYREGIAQGEKKAYKRVREFFDKYLDYSLKEPSNKTKERKLKEFEELLKNS